MDTEHDEASFACPHCGEPMTPGEIGFAGPNGFSISWSDIQHGEAGTPGTLYVSPRERDAALVRPGLVCRPCESIYVDFQMHAPEAAPAAPRGFEERVRDMHGSVNMDSLVTILREGDPRACSRAVQAFVEIGAAAIPRLRELCEDEDPDVRVDAAKALELIESAS